MSKVIDLTMRTTAEVELSYIADVLAGGGSIEQAHFINVFAHRLNFYCEERADTQQLFIVDELDDAGKEFIKSLAEFIKLKESTDANN